MATRFKVQPPTRPDGNEPIKYTCEECGAKDIEDIEIHVNVRGHSPHLIMDYRFISYYNVEKADVAQTLL